MKAIYKIQSIIKPEEFYIGATKNLKRRISRHKQGLNTNTHHNARLQAHVNKYGIEDFIFSVIEEVGEGVDLISIEQSYVDSLRPTFNICIIDVDSSLGVKRSDEYRIKMSIAKKGKPHRPECKAEKSLRQTGKKRGITFNHTEEAKRKISLNNGRKREIIQYDLMGKKIKDWPTILSAATGLGICRVAICTCCRGKIKTSGGYKWGYKI
jgi:group I intron endonuclease